MPITPDTTPANILAVIESRCGKIPPATRELIEGFINDGLNPDFIWDAGIETIAQHLEDVLERISDAHSYHKHHAKQGISINASTGERIMGDVHAAATASGLLAARRIITKATR